MIVHSYLIAKKIIKLKEHVDAAKLLNRGLNFVKIFN